MQSAGPTPRRRQGDTMAESIRRHVIQRIVAGELAPGAHLVEGDIADELGVSRTPVRDAMQSLIELGLVAREPHRGCFVARATPPEICRMLEAREATEGVAARLAAIRCSDTDIAALAALHDEMTATAQDEAYLTYRALHFEFHCRVIRGSGNEYIARYVGAEPLLLKCLINYPPGFIAPVLHVHREIPHASILNAIATRDAEAAEIAARDHIRTTRERLERWHEHNSPPQGRTD